MAGFCTKCGFPMPSSTGFCPACGTSAAAGAVPAQPEFAPVSVPGEKPAQLVGEVYSPSQGYAGVVPPPAAAHPVAAYPVAQPAKSGGPLKIILIVIAIVVGLGVIAAGVVGYGVFRVSRTIKESVQTDSKGNATVSVMGSTISAGKNVNMGEAELGVPIYPGATKGEGGMHMTLPTLSMSSATFMTPDAVSTVVAFYKGKLGENESDIDTDTGSVLSSGKDGTNNKSGTVITVTKGSGKAEGKTAISIVRTISTAR